MQHSIRYASGLLAALLLAAPTQAQEQVAVKAGKVITISGGEIENAVILIENGKIKSVGADTEVPWNARVVDASDKVVMPTYVRAHASAGMSGTNENLANVPYISVADGIDPSSGFFSEALRNGVGSIHIIPGNRTLIGGSGMVVRPVGKTVEDMAIRTKSGLKLSLDPQNGSRMAQIRKMRRALQDYEDYRKDLERQKKEWEAEKAAGATEEEEFPVETDETKQPVLDLMDGKVKGYLYVPSAAELGEVARLKNDRKLDLVLVLGPACYKGVDDIKALDLPVILTSNMEYRERDPETGEESTTCPAEVFTEAGIDFALSISDQGSGSARYPWWQMATAIRYGMDRNAALRSMTLEPAKILGIDAEFGSIEAGKVANLQVLTGDPLEATTWVETVLLEGEVVYERSKDRRLQHLFGEGEDRE
ncbi:MAG: amidohydrolase family protein [Planctomycetota bacterium]